MIIMAKFEKRLRKMIGNVDNAMVIGAGFGFLPEFINVFNTIFLFSFGTTNIKSKKIVPKENLNDLNSLTEVSAIIIDRNQVHRLDQLLPIWHKFKPVVIIEGNEVIGRDLSLALYKAGYQAVEQQDQYHVWKI